MAGTILFANDTSNAQNPGAHVGTVGEIFENNFGALAGSLLNPPPLVRFHVLWSSPFLLIGPRTFSARCKLAQNLSSINSTTQTLALFTHR